jgi:hypothetical protein
MTEHPEKLTFLTAIFRPAIWELRQPKVNKALNTCFIAFVLASPHGHVNFNR